MNYKLVKISFASSSILLALGLSVFYIRKVFYRKRQTQNKNKIILHYFYDATYKSPSRSLDLIRLETWLKFAGITYELNIPKSRFYSISNSLFIRINENIFTNPDDSITYLAKTLGKDLSDGLNHVEKSISRGVFYMCKESLSKCLMIMRFKYGNRHDISLSLIEFFINKHIFKKMIRFNTYENYPKEKVIEIAIQDLKALDDFLRNKEFMFGSSVCAEDAYLFGVISQFVCFDESEIGFYLREKCFNIMRFYENVKSIYWKEWDNRIIRS
ncbi:unnamed protein product [Brachionus calyciflorus]|uniref:Metaxin glutathione S-transferase domain-containing protein n=1 Tax=Brachionus calyciflorus TaxID=104777 RepID=A0A813WKQ1_9BILA|nr:unnamed protein product [Brachionus calyciflorus]